MLSRRDFCRAPQKKVTLEVEALEDRLLLNATTPVITPQFLKFNVVDASGDGTPGNVFQGGALKVIYDFLPGGGTTLNKVTLEAWQSSNKIADLGSFNSERLSDGYVGLQGRYWQLPAGAYAFRARADLADGSTAVSGWKTIGVVGVAVTNGTFQGETFGFSSVPADGLVVNAVGGNAFIVNGAGGTDTLQFGIELKQVASINGMKPARFNPLTEQQAIFQGKLVDYIRLKDGKEIYFTGIERLEFKLHEVKSTVINLAVSTFDEHFADQWNLHATDVPSAWRFTKGSSNILIASLDTGVLPSPDVFGDPVGQVTDINLSRLITDAHDDDSSGLDTPHYGHGHMAISVMAATATTSLNASKLSPISFSPFSPSPTRHSFGVGINWNSKVYVNNVYDSETLQGAISETLAYAEANNMKVVFQGGIQGDSWLTSGGTQADLESLISDAADYSLFAVAAGNGGPGGGLNDPDYLTSVSGVAALQTNHANVMSVGALKHTAIDIHGKINADSVFLADYSNRGSNLTIVAPTDSPATSLLSDTETGEMTSFGGTSCANPNMAGIASLVWSANPNLTAAQVRSIVTSTAMDLGAAGRDNTFGFGLVNADLAVRRARALFLNPALAGADYWNVPLIKRFDTNLITTTLLTSTIRTPPSEPAEQSPLPSAALLAAPLPVLADEQQPMLTFKALVEPQLLAPCTALDRAFAELAAERTTDLLAVPQGELDGLFAAFTSEDAGFSFAQRRWHL